MNTDNTSPYHKKIKSIVKKGKLIKKIILPGKCLHARASIHPKKWGGGDGLQIRKVRRYATRIFFNVGTLKWHFQRFGGTCKVIVQCA
jgi:hypothetical protein